MICPPEGMARAGTAGPGESFVTYVASELGNVAIKVKVPPIPRYIDHTAVVVNVATFFTQTQPFYSDLEATDVGLIHISYIWPGAEERTSGHCSEGIYDHGGATDIASLRDVVRYALGDLADIEGQTISERVTGLSPGEVGLWAFSHPGIAAINVLARHQAELGNVRWLVGVENPTQDQHCAVELGHFGPEGERVINELYEIERDYTPGLYDLDLSTARWDPSFVEEGHEDEPGRAFFDRDDDGYTPEVDHMLSYRIPTMWDKRYLSRALTNALRDNGLSEEDWPADLATPEEADAAWESRTSIDGYADLAGSDLKIMLVFSERQHVQPLADAPSIHSAWDGLRTAGLWVRINPDQVYAEQSVGGAWPEFPDHVANAEPSDWSNAGETLGYGSYSGTITEPLRTHVGWAAVTEMADRTEFNDWSTDLDATLVPGR